MGTRADWLVTAIAHGIDNLRRVQGGKPPQLCGKLIEWGDKTKDEQAEEMSTFLQSIGAKKVSNG